MVEVKRPAAGSSAGHLFLEQYMWGQPPPAVRRSEAPLVLAWRTLVLTACYQAQQAGLSPAGQPRAAVPT
jgi:hypothetical protein